MTVVLSEVNNVCPPPLFGLLQQVEVEQPDNKRWQFEDLGYFTASCQEGQTTPLNCDIDYGAAGKFLPTSEEDWNIVYPFQVIHGDGCSTVDLSWRPFRELAEQNLQRHEFKAVEKALWSGVIDPASGVLDPNIDYLSKPGLVTQIDGAGFDAASAVPAKTAFGMLEKALMDACVKYIHVPVSLIPFLTDLFIRDEDGFLRTHAGSFIIVGNGYDGSGPGDQNPDGSHNLNVPSAPGEDWIYGTGKIRVFKGDLRTSPPSEENFLEALNFGQNRLEFRAERAWAVGVDPCIPIFALRAKYCDPI